MSAPIRSSACSAGPRCSLSYFSAASLRREAATFSGFRRTRENDTRELLKPLVRTLDRLAFGNEERPSRVVDISIPFRFYIHSEK